MGLVLLCVRAGSPELPAVAAALRARGVEPIVLDPSVFPDGVALSLAYERGEISAQWGSLASSAGLRGVSAVWQHVVVGQGLPAMAPGVRETCIVASEHAVVGLLDNLDAFQLDPRGNQARADNKPRQLRLAQQLGLEVPATLISNDAAAVRAFAARHGAVIAKMLEQTAGPASEAGTDVVFTTELGAAELERLDGLDLCPMIFQERIANQRDLRVTVVGKQCFAAALDAEARDGDVDWRRESYALDRVPAWAPCDLPRGIAEPLIQLADRFGLNYAAADLVMTPDERYVFLEINAGGAFTFLGEPIAGTIAGAIADVLVDPGARRVFRDV